MTARETMNVVIVGHVDHGKSTVIGRLLADTGAIAPQKLDAVRTTCQRQGKEFEYAFLLDALEEEQGQGITIDSARVFFRGSDRDYIIIDAPGHVEFLKNMITGAARAEAAILVIDANEGVRENSRRHGYLLSMLGIKQVVVAVNKIDLVDYSKSVFDDIVTTYRAFLGELGMSANYFIPVSARHGDLIVNRTDALSWFDGPSIIEAMDSLRKRESDDKLPLRLPVQDVYKFNEHGDDRRIVVGRVESGRISVGDEVLFSPSNKPAIVRSIEAFPGPGPSSASAGQSIGITLNEELYVRRGEVISAVNAAPMVSTRLRVSVFWLGREPMIRGKTYRLKLATSNTECSIESIERVFDASELAHSHDADEVARHAVAELVLTARHPIAADPMASVASLGRFVIVDGYDTCGGGVIRELIPDEQVQRRLESKIRNLEWARGDVGRSDRARMNGHPASMVMITGDVGTGKAALARAVEARLVDTGHHAYLVDGRNLVLGVDSDIAFDDIGELVRRFGEVAYLLLDAGNLVVSTTNVIGLANHDEVEALISPFEMLVVHLGPKRSGGADLRFDPNPTMNEAVDQVVALLAERRLLLADTRPT